MSASTASDPIALVVEARPRDLGGFGVRRALPSGDRRMVGPFIFFDHMGPTALPPGHGIDVRPHPHIALATVTYLFEGEIVHRDSLGSHQPIRPGDVNWMLAGRGHRALRTNRRRGPTPRRPAARDPVVGGAAARARGERPRLRSPPGGDHPGGRPPGRGAARGGGDRLRRALAGAASRRRRCTWRRTLEAGATLPLPDEHPERAVYVVEGELAVGARRFGPGAMVVLHAGPAEVRRRRRRAPGHHRRRAARRRAAHLVELRGSARPTGSSAPRPTGARVGSAVVPGDELEFIPLPEG